MLRVGARRRQRGFFSPVDTMLFVCLLLILLLVGTQAVALYLGAWAVLFAIASFFVAHMLSGLLLRLFDSGWVFLAPAVLLFGLMYVVDMKKHDIARRTLTGANHFIIEVRQDLASECARGALASRAVNLLEKRAAVPHLATMRLDVNKSGAWKLVAILDHASLKQVSYIFSGEAHELHFSGTCEAAKFNWTMGEAKGIYRSNRLVPPEFRQ